MTLRFASLALVSTILLYSQQPLDVIPKLGMYPTGSYTPSEVDSVDNTNGNVFVQIPLATLPPGPGGATRGFSLSYNSMLYDNLEALDGGDPMTDLATITALQSIGHEVFRPGGA